MNNKKEVIIFTIIIIALLVIIIGGITFAYFASDKTTSNFNLDVSTANSMYTFESQTNDNIEFNINFNEMSEATANNETAVKSNTANINVTLTNPEDGMMTKCTYDIVWVWDSNDKYTEADVETLPYTDEATGEIYNYEFSTKVDEDAERDLSNLSLIESKKVVLRKEIIMAMGKNSIVNNHEITANIYNLPVDQSNIFNKNFRAHIEIENVNCRMEKTSVGEYIKMLYNDNSDVGDGELIFHNGQIIDYSYTNRSSLYITEEHATEYESINDIIKHNWDDIRNSYDYLTYDSTKKQYKEFEFAAEQAVKDGYLGINESILDAADGSYRFSGNQPNNYICFGSGSEQYNSGEIDDCPTTNKYRIIGLVPVIKSNGEKDNLVKIIKAEYLTAAELGKTKNDGNAMAFDIQGYINLKRIEADAKTLDGFHWNDKDGENSQNIWEDSTLYNSLNDETIGYLKFLYGDNIEIWKNKIEDVKWNVGGWNDYIGVIPKEMYEGEMTDGGCLANNCEKYPIKQGSGTTVDAKIGLMYANDYTFASVPNNWKYDLVLNDYGSYNSYSNRKNNWLFNGVSEWTITRESSQPNFVIDIGYFGIVEMGVFRSFSYGVRPVFYLKSNVNIIKDKGADGSIITPYKVVL